MLGICRFIGLTILGVVLLGVPPVTYAQHTDIGTPPVLKRVTPKQPARQVNRLYEPDQWINTMSRSAVRAAYWDDFRSTENVPPDWTGDVTTGDPGDTSQAYKEAVMRRVNWFRAMAGVPAWITLNLEFSRKAQQAALMFSANQALSHFPPMSWMHYTAEGAEAAENSNICLTFNAQQPDPGCVAGYMQDEGATNSAVGHRRWIENPSTREMGTGDVPQNGQFSRANSLWVFDSHLFDPRPPTRHEFVAWPPPGYVPHDVIYRRWSFGFPQADFSGATVAMETDGQTVPVQTEPISNGFGDNTLVWFAQPPAGNAAGSIADMTHKITISNVMVGGVSRNFSYEVMAFDPNVAGPGPEFPDAGLVSSASAQSGPLTSEFWMDIYGQNLSTHDQWDGDLPPSLGGTAVIFTDSNQVEHHSRLHWVTPLRVQFVTPPNMAPGPGKIRVENPLGSFSTTVQIEAIRPALFTANSNGQGPMAGTWLRVDQGGNQFGGFTSSGDPVPNRVNLPVSFGSESDLLFLALYGSGFASAASVTARIDGVDVPVDFFGPRNTIGGGQINLGPLPRSLIGRKDARIELFFDGVPANVVTVSFE